ncbi:8-oxo-dGTP pyrophosphatase MutT (NUDIX family) [Nocardioides marinisabuli]|uniref:8-oxo-dGTP pyrophosphatase MutT (NUDIX family) n=1 Tax=Nocardioides marinisabuli TaxID=419476 RepID=A0A7Y9JNH1_9ACTN|nr:NUDIX hydrolase [Nocardioides marinisabuli]NYD55882.1 8-oxo-dGTP pyrophosphatase MutT (NUDIX family) [Nocardioides marinisabuli]
MSLHADAVAVLSAWSAPDAGQEELRERYLAHLHDCPEAMRREGRPDHLTASTLVLSADGERVLLTLHAKARRWFQLGGHCEAGDPTLAAAALREATEESGLTGLRLDPVPVQLSAHAVPFCGGTPERPVHHLDVRFVAVATDDEQHAVSEESLDVRWWPTDALPDPERDLVDLVRLARARLRAQSISSPSSRAADQPIR